MRFLIGILGILLWSVKPVFAQQASPLRLLLTGDDSRGWEAVGRLNVGGINMCTGALISPRLVLTAAHCLFDGKTGKQVDATSIEFLAGWRSGRATAYAKVRRAVVHPDYVFGHQVNNNRIRNDLALLQLTQPINKTSVTPFRIDNQPSMGAQVEVVSYAFDRAQSPSLQKACYVLSSQSGAFVFSCDVDYGSSGAPIFTMRDGKPWIVSVVSAKAEVNGSKVALGSILQEPLLDIIKVLRETEPRFPQTVALETTLEPQLGAKFLRP